MEREKARLFLDEIIAGRGITYADVSRLIGRNHSYIQQFIKRGIPRRLDEQDRRVIARHFAVAEHLLSGFPPSQNERSSISRSPRSTLLPKLVLGAPEGVRAPDEDVRSIDAVAIDAQWLRGIGAQPSHASVTRVDGESMAPTLRHGDDLIIDHSDNIAKLRDGIYVLRLDDVLMVKRIAMGPRRGMFSIVSDNSLYPSWAEMDLDMATIVGRVVWVGRTLC